MKHISSRLLLLLAASVFPGIAFGHGVDDGTQQFLMDNDGIAIVPFMYIGAKHMVTGYDHLLFLLGVIFFLYRKHIPASYLSSRTCLNFLKISKNEELKYYNFIIEELNKKSKIKILSSEVGVEKLYKIINKI